MGEPKISVVMPVRNGDPFLSEALTSILSQECVDFECIVIDDGSIDGTARLLASIEDPRLRVFQGTGTGLVNALNLGLSHVRGDYVARMDADDVSLPGRLRRQEEILDTRPDIDMVHSAVRIIDATGRITGELSAQSLDPTQRTAVLLAEQPGAPIVHPSVMMRRRSIQEAGGYRESPSCEDTELWLRVVDHWGVAAIEEPLLLYRQHDGGISRERALEQAISSLTNWIAHRYRVATGTDLQSVDPARHNQLRERIAEVHGPRLDALCRVRALRRKIKQGRPGEAAVLFAAVLLSGHVMSISGRIERRSLVRIQHRLLAELLAGDEIVSGP